MNAQTTYTIQSVSRQTDLPTSTLRYYEEEGLLLPIARAPNGHRRYTETDVMRVNLIKKLRLTGMTIEAMRVFVALYQGGKQTAAQRRAILEAHRHTVQARVNELVEMLGFIDYKIGLYHDEEREHEHEVSLAGENRPVGV